MSNKGVCRSAPATPGLLNTKHLLSAVKRKKLNGEAGQYNFLYSTMIKNYACKVSFWFFTNRVLGIQKRPNLAFWKNCSYKKLFLVIFLMFLNISVRKEEENIYVSRIDIQ